MAILPEHDCTILAEVCHQARLSRDARFDGQFYTGVFSTGIYCRSICPASPPLEKNVRYFDSPIKAANHGLRPCLRCRPDSAPHSYAWIGTQTTLQRAIKLIDNGAMAGESALSVEQLSDKLGISSRYLVKLFTQYLGTSPKQYALYQQVMFAKTLLHQTRLPITEVALASGFKSIRSFNEKFKQTLQLTPTDLRKGLSKSLKENLSKASVDKSEKVAQTESKFTQSNDQNIYQNDDMNTCASITLKLSYRPPLNWQAMHDFYHLRQVDQMEWLAEDIYGRSFNLNGVKGILQLKHRETKSLFELTVKFVRPDDSRYLAVVVNAVRKMLDLDADMLTIENQLKSIKAIDINSIGLKPGLRIPATFSVFEAACRAVLGQQVSVVQASKLLNTLVEHYGEWVTLDQQTFRFFPTPEAIGGASLDELKMPGARKLALNGLGQFVHHNPQSSPLDWLNVKGIGPWTVAYAQMRGESQSNVFLTGDLVIKNRLKALCNKSDISIETVKQYQQLAEKVSEQAAPWGSYLTFQLWSAE